MAHLFNRNVLLGVSGGIAAYKSAELVRLLQNHGASVRVIMTRGAQEFITPLTLSTLSKNPVYSSFTDEDDENATWNNHVELGLWADYMLIAPATANIHHSLHLLPNEIPKIHKIYANFDTNYLILVLIKF